MKNKLIFTVLFLVLLSASCGSDKKNEIVDSDIESFSDEDGEAVMDNDTTEPSS